MHFRHQLKQKTTKAFLIFYERNLSSLDYCVPLQSELNATGYCPLELHNTRLNRISIYHIDQLSSFTCQGQ
jgi:hypothetical protein